MTVLKLYRVLYGGVNRWPVVAVLTIDTTGTALYYAQYKEIGVLWVEPASENGGLDGIREYQATGVLSRFAGVSAEKCKAFGMSRFRGGIRMYQALLRLANHFLSLACVRARMCARMINHYLDLETLKIIINQYTAFFLSLLHFLSFFNFSLGISRILRWHKGFRL